MAGESFFDLYGGALEKLMVYGLGIAAFTLVVAILYIPMSHRLMFGRRRGEHDVSTEGRKLVYVLLFPLVSFAFFLVMVGALLFLSNTAGTDDTLLTPDLLTISMGIVLAIRITAYFSEKAAEELGKIMPLGLLGVFLVTSTGDLDLTDSIKKLEEIPKHLDLVGVFFAVIVIAEFTLRGIYALFNRPVKPKPKPPVVQNRPR